MKCPKCGSEISNDSDSCPKCGVRIVKRELAQPESKAKPPRDWRTLILHTLRSKWFVIGIFLLLVGEAAALIFLSPAYSPLGGIRDSDHDGVPDNYDAAPHDPAMWAVGSSDIVLTLHNSNYYTSIHYRVFVNAEQKLEGDIAESGTVVKSMTIPFLVGLTTNHTVGLTVTVDNSNWYGGASRTLENGQNYPITFNMPY